MKQDNNLYRWTPLTIHTQPKCDEHEEINILTLGWDNEYVASYQDNKFYSKDRTDENGNPIDITQHITHWAYLLPLPSNEEIELPVSNESAEEERVYSEIEVRRMKNALIKVKKWHEENAKSIGEEGLLAEDETYMTICDAISYNQPKKEVILIPFPTNTKEYASKIHTELLNEARGDAWDEAMVSFYKNSNGTSEDNIIEQDKTIYLNSFKTK